jgi:hypothetical protein
MVPVEFYKDPEGWIKENNYALQRRFDTVFRPEDRIEMQDVLMRRYLKRTEDRERN